MGIRCALWVAVLMVAARLNGDDRRQLDLVWLDAHGLFPDFDRVRVEADAIFSDLEVSVG